LKILQIYELAPTGIKAFNGIDVSILEISRELAKLGHDVTILTGRSGNNDIDSCGDVNIVQVEFFNLMKKTWDPVNLRLSRQLIFPLAVLGKKFRDFDIYHGHIYASGLIALYFGKINNGKVVNTIHGSYYPIWHLLASPWESFFYKKCERILAPFLAKHVDLQIHTGEYFAKKVIEWGAPPSKVKIIRNGVNINEFNKKDSKKDKSIIFTARRLVKKNGVEYLLKAMKKISEKVDCELWIAGDGPERSSLEKLTERLELKNKVVFLGLVPHDKIPELLAQAEIAVLPSLIEASSLFLLEAMGMGKPIVATNVGDNQKILDGSAILVNPCDIDSMAEGILGILADDKRKNEMRKKVLEKVRGYTWEKVARMIEEEYLRISRLN
jgi:glycosyltransferase involved in cell wall biosynthesis